MQDDGSLTSLMMVPTDPEAERRVVGACLLSPSAIVLAMAQINPTDFFVPGYRWTFGAIIEMAMNGKPVNIQTVIRHLKTLTAANGNNALDEMGGASVVVGSVEGVLPEEVEFWAAAVRKKRAERDVWQVAEWAHREISKGTDIVKVKAKLEERLSAMGHDEDEAEIVSVGENMGPLEARIDRYIDDPEAITGMEVDWGPFDRAIDGFQPGNVSIVYAPTSRFKSMFVTNIGWRLARKGYRGIWYTTEMPALQVKERLLQLEAGLNFRWLRREGEMGKHRADIKSAMRSMAGLPIEISDRSDVEVGRLAAAVIRRKKYQDIKYIIVDLIDFVSVENYKDNSVQQESAIMKKMKSLAKKADIHVILVSHIAKGDKALRNAADLDVEEMKGSSAKSQDVDLAISVMPVMPNPEKPGEYIGMTRKDISLFQKEKRNMTMMVSLTKNRHGELEQILMSINLRMGGRIAPLDTKRWVQQHLDKQAVEGHNET